MIKKKIYALTIVILSLVLMGTIIQYTHATTNIINGQDESDIENSNIYEYSQEEKDLTTSYNVSDYRNAEMYETDLINSYGFPFDISDLKGKTFDEVMEALRTRVTQYGVCFYWAEIDQETGLIVDSIEPFNYECYCSWVD